MSNIIVDHLLRTSSALLLALWSAPLLGAPPVKASVCEIMQKPSAFNGKLVQVRGIVNSGFENFSLSESGCGPIWVDFADERFVSPEPKFKLVRDMTFLEFERRVKADSSAEVTLIGRLDGVDQIKTTTSVTHKRKHKDGSVSAVVGTGSTGFGHMGEYKARLVLKRVVNVRCAPILPPPIQVTVENRFHSRQLCLRLPISVADMGGQFWSLLPPISWCR